MSTLKPNEAQVLVQETFIKQCIQVAIFSLLVYDTLITFDKEKKYLWTRRWSSWSHVLFFSNRYIGVIAAVSQIVSQSLFATSKLCLFGSWVASLGNIIVCVIMDYILMLRVLALWHNSKALSIGLYALILFEAITKLALTIVIDVLQDLRLLAIPGGMKVCVSQNYQLGHTGFYKIIDWVTAAAVGFILLLLALCKVLEHWKLSGVKGSSLLNIMIKDQFVYYIMVLFCSSINTTNSLTQSSESGIRKAVFQLLGNPGFLSLLGSRMFLNLKEAGELQVAKEKGFPKDTGLQAVVSGLNFAGTSTSSYT